MPIIKLDKATEYLAKVRKDKKRIVFTNGCFDIIHRGHVSYLEQARNLGDFLIVGLNSDESVKRLKGRSRPFNNETDRAEVLNGLKSVNMVTIFEDDTPLNLIKIIKPDILVKGADYLIGSIVGADEVLSWGGEVEIIEYLEGYGTSELIKKIVANSSI